MGAVFPAVTTGLSVWVWIGSIHAGLDHQVAQAPTSEAPNYHRVGSLKKNRGLKAGYQKITKWIALIVTKVTKFSVPVITFVNKVM